MGISTMITVILTSIIFCLTAVVLIAMILDFREVTYKRKYMEIKEKLDELKLVDDKEVSENDS